MLFHSGDPLSALEASLDFHLYRPQKSATITSLLESTKEYCRCPFDIIPPSTNPMEPYNLGFNNPLKGMFRMKTVLM